MGINREFFFAETRKHLFSGRLGRQQVAGMAAILDRFEAADSACDDRHLAYMLATAYHETARTMQPVRETLASSDARAIAILDRAFATGKLPSVSRPYWRADAQGRSWLGRGFVQLTHRANYARMSALTGIDLLADPERAMDLPVAVAILFTGMAEGSFTGRRLSDYFSSGRENWTGARRIINGQDRAAEIAAEARAFYAAISHTAG